MNTAIWAGWRELSLWMENQGKRVNCFWVVVLLGRHISIWKPRMNQFRCSRSLVTTATEWDTSSLLLRPSISLKEWNLETMMFLKLRLELVLVIFFSLNNAKGVFQMFIAGRETKDNLQEIVANILKTTNNPQVMSGNLFEILDWICFEGH